MKNFKVALLAIAMLVGVSSAFAYQAKLACAQGTALELPSSSETWVGNGAVAADQNIANYVPAGSYECLTAANVVCTFYLDESGEEPVIRQCEKGTFQ